jgi:beta-lactamase regulating signal transducer with metallopeptidase domain/ketosteroid isomerase-like protein
MNAVITVLNQAGGLFVSHAGAMFVQAGILILLLWALDHVLRRRLRASLRYGLWMLVLVKLVLSPQFSLPTGVGNWAGHLSSDSGPLLPIQLGGHVTRPPSAKNRNSPLPVAAMHGTTSPTGDSVTTLASSGAQVPDVPVRLEWPGILLAGWLAGVCVFGLALLTRAVTIRRIVRDASPPGEAMRDLLARCQRDVGLAGNVQLKLTRDVSSPAVCRVWRPVILVPQALTDGLPEDSQRAMLIHELCHIKRADAWVNLVQTLLQVFYFYNPLVWLANASIRPVREQAVDERVLVCLRGQLRCYSHTLIDIASAMTRRARLGMGLIGVPESKTRLNERIQLMLYRPTPRSPGLGMDGLVTLIALGCTLLPMAAAQGGANAPAGAALVPADPQTSEKLLKDVQTAADQMASAFNSKQVDSLMSHYGADVITMAPGEPAAVGMEAQQKALAKDMGNGFQIRSFKLPLNKVVVCGDLIYMGGLYSLTVAAPDGSNTNTDARCGLMIAQRQKDGSLKLKLEAYNRPNDADQPVDASAAQVLCCTPESPTLPANAPLYDQIRDLDRRVEKMFVDNKRAEALEQYADDAVLMANGGQVFMGRDALKKLFEQSPNQAMQDIELKFAHIEGSEQVVYVVKWCGWKLKNPVSGMDYIIPGKSLHVWQRQPDGSWKIAFDLNNLDLTL